MIGSLRYNKSLRKGRAPNRSRLSNLSKSDRLKYRQMTPTEMRAFRTRLINKRKRMIVIQIISLLIITAIVTSAFYWLIFG